MVNSDRTKAMHILQATYTHIRYFLVTKLHYARNVPHTYRRYPEKVATVKNSLEVGGGGGGENQTAGKIPCKCGAKRAGIIFGCRNSNNLRVQRNCTSI